jgi:hypothetical protein
MAVDNYIVSFIESQAVTTGCNKRNCFFGTASTRHSQLQVTQFHIYAILEKQKQSIFKSTEFFLVTMNIQK